MSLTQLRYDVAAALEAAGIRADSYVAERVTPPIAVVVPDEPYIAAADGDDPAAFAYPHLIRVAVLLIGGKGTNKATAEDLDAMIVTAVGALDDYAVLTVTQPGEIGLNGHSYLGSVISIEHNTKIGA